MWWFDIVIKIKEERFLWRRNLKRILALVLAVVMVIGLAACGDKEGDKKGGGSVSTNRLAVGYAQFSQKFSSFYADICSMIRTKLVWLRQVLTPDRKGEIIKKWPKKQKEYNGKNSGAKVSLIRLSYDEAKDQTVYKAEIHIDVKFSDGKLMTADDIILHDLCIFR